MKYRLWIKNNSSPVDGSFIASDDELNHVEQGKSEFEFEKVLETMAYIYAYDQSTEFRIIPITYYIHAQDFVDAFVGPFNSREAAQSQIDTVIVPRNDSATLRIIDDAQFAKDNDGCFCEVISPPDDATWNPEDESKPFPLPPNYNLLSHRNAEGVTVTTSSVIGSIATAVVEAGMILDQRSDLHSVVVLHDGKETVVTRPQPCRLPRDIEERIRRKFPATADRIIAKWYDYSQLDFSEASFGKLDREIKMVHECIVGRNSSGKAPADRIF